MEQESFYKANLHGANLNKANLSALKEALPDSDVNIYGHTVEYPLEGVEYPPGEKAAGADLSGADLTDADVSGADLTDADLAGTILTNIFYDGSTVWPKGFNPPPSRPIL